MVSTVKKSSPAFARFALIVASILLVAGFSVLLLEKSGITNIYTKPVSASTQEPARPINNVDYSPATSTEQAEGDALKNKIIEQSNQTVTPTSNITITLSAAGQDVKGGPVIVRTILSGATTGTCKLTLVKDGVSKTYRANIVMIGTYYGCEGFSVPVTDLSAGAWKLNLSASSASATGSASQDVQVTL